MDFYDEAGVLILGSRLKRLSDKILSDISRLYREAGIPFDISWFPFFYLLKDDAKGSITEIADKLRISHPAVVQFVEKLEKNKLVHTEKDKSDGRRRMVSLTKQGREMLGRIAPVWEAIEESMNRLMLEKVHLRFLLASLAEMEKSLAEKDLFTRISETLHQTNNQQLTTNN